MSIPHSSNIFLLVKGINVTDIVNHYRLTELKRFGSRLKGRCPIHNDNDPSFVIFPDGKFKCFGCQEYGDGVDLVSKVFNLGSLEAARMIANDFGLQVDRPMSPKERQKARERAAKIAKEKAPELLLKQKVEEAQKVLTRLIRVTERELQLGGPEAYEKLHLLVHKLPWWEHLLDNLDDYSNLDTVLATLGSPEVKKWVS